MSFTTMGDNPVMRATEIAGYARPPGSPRRAMILQPTKREE